MAGTTLDLPHDSAGPKTLVIVWVFTAVMFIFVATRLLVRIKMINQAGRDDFAIGLSTIFSVVFSIFCTISIDKGAGKHIWDLTPSQFTEAIKWNTIAMVFGIMSLLIPKLAVVFLILRTFDPSKSHRIVLYTLLGMGLATAIANCILMFTQCDPPAGLWNPALKPTCWPYSVIMGYSVTNIAVSGFLDIFLAIYPAFHISKLQMSRQKKLTAFCLMGFGSVACVIAIVKVTEITHVGYSNDYTYNTAQRMYWTAVESNVLIMAASIPAFGPLLRYFREKTQTFGSDKNDAKGPEAYGEKTNHFEPNFRTCRESVSLEQGLGGFDDTAFEQDESLKLMNLKNIAAVRERGDAASGDGVNGLDKEPSPTRPHSLEP